MVLDKKQTTIAYRCPHCGAGVMSMVDVFTLGADMIKLKCDCHKSEMTVIRQSDGKIRISVPCLLCPKPHSFTVSPSVFFGNEEFFLQCPYSDMNICFMGDSNHVRAELARSELELLEILESNGITDFSAFHPESDDDEESVDPELLQMVSFVLSELEAEGKIYCRCEHSDTVREDKFEMDVTSEGIVVRCRDCGAKRVISADNSIDAHTFLDSDCLYLD